MKRKPRTYIDAEVRRVLSVSPGRDDHVALMGTIASPTWTVFEAGCTSSALSVLRRHPVAVVVCERDLRPGTWVDVLETVKLMDYAPPLIVTSRLADERLWAEALNLGAYDVLAKPFDRLELNRTLNMAFLHWQHRHDKLGAVPKVMSAG